MLRLQAGKLGSRKLFLVAGRASLGLLAVFLDPGAAVTEDALPFLAGSGLVSDYGSRCRHALDYEHGDTVASDLLRGQSSVGIVCLIVWTPKFFGKETVHANPFKGST